MAESLYGVKRQSKAKGKEISSSTSQSFSSTLSSLISSNASKTPTSKSKATSKEKNNLFTAHNKNVKKRAAKDLEDENTGQKHRTKDDIGTVSMSDLHRSKRRMEEKVRIYNAMKRGEYVNREDGYDDRGLVDFDRKWAEKQIDHDDNTDGSEPDSDSDSPDPTDNETVEYLDEFGRRRKGTKKEAEREQRRARIEAVAKDDAQQFAARPQMPSNIVYGDAIQHQAFNPDRTIAEQMAELAKKRDKSATPPPDTHFDASAEVRTRGTGFYAFSHDKADREREMEELEKARLETERIRVEKSQQQTQKSDGAEPSNEAVAGSSMNTDAQKFMDEFELPSG